MKLRVGRIYLVEWTDTSKIGGWFLKGDEFTSVHCTTIGFLQRHDKSEIVLVQSVNTQQVGNVTTIPRRCIDVMHDITP